jgi:hypothetical protein
MTDYLQVIPNRQAHAMVDFDEQAYIDEALDVLVSIHGSYNGQDERMVKLMASYARSVAIADVMLLMPNSHLQFTKANGTQPSSWFRIREAASNSIMKIRKDLGMDLMSRDPQTKGKQADESLFTMKLKDRSIL